MYRDRDPLCAGCGRAAHKLFGGCPLAARGLFVGCPLTAHGLFVGSPWTVRALSMGYTSHGRPMNIHHKKYKIVSIVGGEGLHYFCLLDYSPTTTEAYLTG